MKLLPELFVYVQACRDFFPFQQIVHFCQAYLHMHKILLVQRVINLWYDQAVKFVQEVSTSAARFFAAEPLLVMVSLNEEAGYKSAQNWPKFSRFPRAGEPSMEAGPKGKKKSRPIIFILTCPTKIYTKT